MFPLQNKTVLVFGLGASGVAAAEFLLRHGSNVVCLDNSQNDDLSESAARLQSMGARVELGTRVAPAEAVDLVVLSPGVSLSNPIIEKLRRRSVPVIGEFELGYQHSLCLNVAVTGTNGKTTTTELIERILKQHQLKTVAAGNIGLPVTAVVDQTRELDVLTLEVSSFQLETIQFFRPAAAVLLNITPDHLDRYSSMEDYARAKARIFENQQAFDWAIVQSEALAQLRKLGIEIPSKVVTFSANDKEADIYVDRGLLISRIHGWSGPLLDMEDCKLRGPHNAENLMAAMAVGRVFRVPLEAMAEAVKRYQPAPHRCELVANIGGVKYINDSKATNLDAVHKALLSIPQRTHGEPNIWLIAGGKDKGFDYHDLGPVLSKHVKGAFLIGETREKIRAAWSLFIPCTLADSLLEATIEAARHAEPGDVVLLSPACSSFDQFENYEHRGEVFRQAVKQVESQEHSGARMERSVRNDTHALAFL